MIVERKKGILFDQSGRLLHRRIAFYSPPFLPPLYTCLHAFLTQISYSCEVINELWVFSEVLEPVAMVPQLLLLRQCTDFRKVGCEKLPRRPTKETQK